jgi:tetratricopeptide (TPR) repeat protein
MARLKSLTPLNNIATSPALPVEQGKNVFFTTPGELKHPPVSFRIMDLEMQVVGMNAKGLAEAKTLLARFIGSVCDEVRGKGYPNPAQSGKTLTRDPKNKEELFSLCEKILPMVWKKYSYDTESNFLAAASLNGILDCDTSCFVVADILNQFGVKSRLVSLLDHTILNVSAGGESFYLETMTSDAVKSLPKGAVRYSDKARLKQEYVITCGEEDFSERNSVTYFNIALAKYMRKDLIGAIADLSKSISLNPNNPQAYNNRGIAYASQDAYVLAIKDFSEAIRLNRYDVGALYLRGSTKSQIKDYTGAIEDFNKVLIYDPEHADSYLGRGIAKHFLKDIKGAKADALMAAKLYEKQGNMARAEEARSLSK